MSITWNGFSEKRSLEVIGEDIQLGLEKLADIFDLEI